MKNKLPVLLLALVCAVLVWLYDVTVVNPNGTSTISGIPVQLDNEAALRAQSLMITDSVTPTVTLRVYGRRSELKKLTKSNIKVSADLSKVSSEGAQQLHYEVQFPANDLKEEYRSSAFINVVRYSSCQVEIRPEVTGNNPNDLDIDIEAMVVAPKELTATGTAATIASIECARVKIDKSEITQTTAKDYSYDLLDHDGKVISRDELTMSSEKVAVTIPVLRKKDVPLVLNIVPGGGATSQNITIDYDPNTITISGDPSIVDRIHQIELGKLYLADVIGPVTKTYPISLPEGVKTDSNINETKVSMTVTGLETKIITVNADDIEMRNEPKGLTAKPIYESIQFTLRGTPAAISYLKEKEKNGENVHVSVDMSGSTQAGMYTLPMTVMLPEGLQVGLIGNTTVTLILS